MALEKKVTPKKSIITTTKLTPEEIQQLSNLAK